MDSFALWPEGNGLTCFFLRNKAATENKCIYGVSEPLACNIAPSAILLRALLGWGYKILGQHVHHDKSSIMSSFS